MKCWFIFVILFGFVCYGTGTVADDPVAIGTSWIWPDYDTIRLPQSLRPSLYNISLRPHIDKDQMKDSVFLYNCSTTIYMMCYEETDIIRLNYYRLSDISKITLSYVGNTGSEITDTLNEFRTDDVMELLEIRTIERMRVGEEYVLTIDFTGKIDDTLRGFYYSPYKEDGETKYMFQTMFEPTDARRLFPCFDEPTFKAVFLFNIARKAGMTSVTNLPKRVTLGPDKEGYYIDVFDEPRNVPMSTYLVAIVIGDIAYRETFLNHIKLRTWSRKSAVHLTAYALQMERECMEFFENYFNITYPLPKEDMVAVPAMSFSAMENFGLIVYREDSMLFEHGVSSEQDKEWITILIAHEVSHQWFGNIVSPTWWDDLWLNEGFATYMMYLSVNALRPEWKMMNKFIVAYRGVQNVFDTDSTLASHPVYTPVYHPDEIIEIFDLISYAKGGAVIRMMNFFLGEDTFKQGLTRYLKKFSFATATHNDLWSSLSEQAIINNNAVTDVKAIMDTWLLEKNFPVVMVTRSNSSTFHLSQKAFLLDGNQRHNRSNIFWDIPFVFTTDVEKDFDKTSKDITWLHKDGDEVTVNHESCKWVIGNVMQYGYYRVNYDEANWLAILDQLRDDHLAIHAINRAQIINDAWNLFKAGLLGSNIHLKTLEYLDKETDYVPWKAALRELQKVRTLLQLTPAYGDFKEFMRRKLQKVYVESSQASDHYDLIKYSMIAEEACSYGLKACVDDAVEAFNQWKTDDNYSVNSNLKSTVYCTGVLHGGTEAWNYVLAMYSRSESSVERKFLLKSLACVNEPWIMSKLIVMAMEGDTFSKPDRIEAMTAAASKPIGRLMLGPYLEVNWRNIYNVYGSGLNLFAQLINAVAAPYNTPDEFDRLVRIVKTHPEQLGTGKNALLGSMEQAMVSFKWMETHYDDIYTWLRDKVQ